MSPRSEEFMASARERIRAAHAAREAGFPSVDFGELFVSTGRFDSALVAAVRRVQELREAGDYDAREISGEQAQTATADAEAFVARVAALLGG